MKRLDHQESFPRDPKFTETKWEYLHIPGRANSTISKIGDLVTSISGMLRPKVYSEICTSWRVGPWGVDQRLDSAHTQAGAWDLETQVVTFFFLYSHWQDWCPYILLVTNLNQVSHHQEWKGRIQVDRQIGYYKDLVCRCSLW
jgi:hypothetical protein